MGESGMVVPAVKGGTAILFARTFSVTPRPVGKRLFLSMCWV